MLGGGGYGGLYSGDRFIIGCMFGIGDRDGCM